ncbi:hypothetical protein R5H32_20690 [Defluviimonas sp. D31]|nr:hypothetical protein [Defluviimonas sp. D31]MDW4551741.1 hypothetical protein [Defluviimonas sp. D31]
MTEQAKDDAGHKGRNLPVSLKIGPIVPDIGASRDKTMPGEGRRRSA